MFWKKKLNEISDMPELVRVLKKRTKWKKIDPVVIDLLAQHAEETVVLLNRFYDDKRDGTALLNEIVYLSEKEGLPNNFIQLSKDKTSSPEDKLALFAVTFQNLGNQYLSTLDHTVGDNFQLTSWVALMSYRAGLTCNKYCLSIYLGFIQIFMHKHLKWYDLAGELFDCFDEVVLELKNTDSGSLSYFNQAVKKDMNDIVKEMRAAKKKYLSAKSHKPGDIPLTF